MSVNRHTKNDWHHEMSKVMSIWVNECEVIELEMQFLQGRFQHISDVKRDLSQGSLRSVTFSILSLTVAKYSYKIKFTYEMG